MSVLVVGVGSEWGDDVAGLLVARRLAGAGREAVEADGEPARLLELIALRDDVVIVDAMRAGGPPGRIRRVDPDRLPRSSRRSSHGQGVAEAIGLASVLDRGPRRLRVYGICGRRFEPGDRVSPEVEVAALALASRLGGGARCA